MNSSPKPEKDDLLLLLVARGVNFTCAIHEALADSFSIQLVQFRLNRLEKKYALLKSRRERRDKAPCLGRRISPRRVYKLTEKGQARVAELRAGG